MMKKMFKTSDHGLFSFYMGIQVQKIEGEIILSQKSFALKILSNFKLQDFNPSQRPKTISLSEGRTKLGFFLIQKFDGHSEIFNLHPAWFDVQCRFS